MRVSGWRERERERDSNSSRDSERKLLPAAVERYSYQGTVCVRSDPYSWINKKSWEEDACKERKREIQDGEQDEELLQQELLLHPSHHFSLSPLSTLTSLSRIHPPPSLFVIIATRSDSFHIRQRKHAHTQTHTHVHTDIHIHGKCQLECVRDLRKTRVFSHSLTT